MRAVRLAAIWAVVAWLTGGAVVASGVPIPVEDYAWDAEGNRTASHMGTVYASNDHNQLLEDASYTYAYDDRGNRISRTSKVDGTVETYAYDSQNRLIGYQNGTTTANYAYDPLDRRIAKTVDGITREYIYDISFKDPLAFDDIVLEFSSSEAQSTAIERRWAHGPSVDEPLGYERYTTTGGVGSGTEAAVFANDQGSIVWIVAPTTGTIVAAYEYDAFGRMSQTQGDTNQPYGYTGREYDAESGLYHYRARAYDPTTGHFLQYDPIEFGSGSFATYAYAQSNPLNSVDPSGLMVTDEFLRGSALNQAQDALATTYVFSGIGAGAGALARQLSDLSLGIDESAEPVGEHGGRCSAAVLEAFDAIKPHSTRCQSGRNNIGFNLANMRIIKREVFVRQMEMFMCFDGGLLGDQGHRGRIDVLFRM